MEYGCISKAEPIGLDVEGEREESGRSQGSGPSQRKNGTAIAGVGNDARRRFEQKHLMIWEP